MGDVDEEEGADCGVGTSDRGSVGGSWTERVLVLVSQSKGT